jgi:hypothetical protein
LPNTFWLKAPELARTRKPTTELSIHPINLFADFHNLCRKFTIYGTKFTNELSKSLTNFHLKTVKRAFSLLSALAQGRMEIKQTMMNEKNCVQCRGFCNSEKLGQIVSFFGTK